MAQLGFADMDDGTGLPGAMIVRPVDQPDDGPGVGFGLSRVPSADEALIERWLHRKSPRTRRMYLATVRRFLATTGKALAEVTFSDLQDFDLSLAGLAESSRAVMIAIVKSLLTFGNRLQGRDNGNEPPRPDPHRTGNPAPPVRPGEPAGPDLAPSRLRHGIPGLGTGQHAVAGPA